MIFKRVVFQAASQLRGSSDVFANGAGDGGGHPRVVWVVGRERAAHYSGRVRFQRDDPVILAVLSGGFVCFLIAPMVFGCLLYTSPSPRDKRQSRMPSSA